MEELKLDLSAGSGTAPIAETDIMERLWTTQPYSKKQYVKKMDRVCVTNHPLSQKLKISLLEPRKSVFRRINLILTDRHKILNLIS